MSPSRITKKKKEEREREIPPFKTSFLDSFSFHRNFHRKQTEKAKSRTTETGSNCGHVNQELKIHKQESI
jgi:hypothetical protein